MLQGNGMLCTAFEVAAPSGRNYLLTAGHCAALSQPLGDIEVDLDNGTKLQRRIIALDKDHDIMLLEDVPHLNPLSLATSDHKGEELRIYGHGNGFPTWEVDCRIMGDMKLGDPDQAWNQTWCSSQAAPGHSGSPALDKDGQVCGIVSRAGMGMTGLVRLEDLQAFLAAY
jgi:S1-C subfamily serine protease